jgi:hypothetical protein
MYKTGGSILNAAYRKVRTLNMVQIFFFSNTQESCVSLLLRIKKGLQYPTCTSNTLRFLNMHTAKLKHIDLAQPLIPTNQPSKGARARR